MTSENDATIDGPADGPPRALPHIEQVQLPVYRPRRGRTWWAVLVFGAIAMIIAAVLVLTLG